MRKISQEEFDTACKRHQYIGREDWEPLNFVNCDLSGIRFDPMCNFSYSTFTGSTFKGALLCDVELIFCNFDGCDFRGAVLNNNKWAMSSLWGALFDIAFETMGGNREDGHEYILVGNYLSRRITGMSLSAWPYKTYWYCKRNDFNKDQMNEFKKVIKRMEGFYKLSLMKG